MKAIRMHRNGGPEVLVWEDHKLPPPAADEVRAVDDRERDEDEDSDHRQFGLADRERDLEYVRARLR